MPEIRKKGPFTVREKKEFKERIERNRGLIFQVANHLFFKVPQLRGSFTLDDFHQEAFLIASRAVQLFDPSLGFQLTTYLGDSLYKQLGRNIMAKTNMIHLPGVDWRKERHQRFASHAERAKKMSRIDPIFDTVLDHRGIKDINLKIDVQNALQVLRPRIRKIVVLYYGLNGDPPCDLEQIGTKLGISKERVRQLKNVGLSRIRIELRGMEHEYTLPS